MDIPKAHVQELADRSIMNFLRFKIDDLKWDEKVCLLHINHPEEPGGKSIYFMAQDYEIEKELLNMVMGFTPCPQPDFDEINSNN